MNNVSNRLAVLRRDSAVAGSCKKVLIELLSANDAKMIGLLKG